MQPELRAIQKDSPAWLFFVRVSFIVSTVAMTIGIYFLPVEIWIKGYLALGLYFTIASSLTLSKTLRDEHEATKFLNKLSEAQTEKLLVDYDLGTNQKKTLLKGDRSVTFE